MQTVWMHRHQPSPGQVSSTVRPSRNNLLGSQTGDNVYNWAGSDSLLCVGRSEMLA